MITFPDTPKDGETVVDKVDDYVVIVWTYNEDKNEWTSHRYGPTEGYVFTDQVLVRDNVQELPFADAVDPSELKTQKDVNWYLNEHGGGDAETAEEVLQRLDDLEVDQARQDEGFATYQGVVAEEQAQQDKELADYKVLVAKEQADQNKAISDEQSARADADAAHDAQLSTLEYKLDTLVGLQFKGVYTFRHDADCDAAYLACLEAAANDPQAQSQCNKDLVGCETGKVSSGTFEAVDPDDQFDHLQAIVIHKNSKDGEELEWASILKAGDYLEVDHKADDSLDKQNYGLYRLKADPVEATNSSGEAVYDIELEFLQGAGDLVESQDYEIRGISADEGINPEELGDFLLKDEAAATYLPLSGGTLTGNLLSEALFKTTRSTGYAFQVRPDNGDTSALIHTDGHGEFSSRVEVDGKKVSLEDHTHDWDSITSKPSTFPPSSHAHNSSYVKGDYTITKTNGNFYIS